MSKPLLGLQHIRPPVCLLHLTTGKDDDYMLVIPDDDGAGETATELLEES